MLNWLLTQTLPLTLLLVVLLSLRPLLLQYLGVCLQYSLWLAVPLLLLWSLLPLQLLPATDFDVYRVHQHFQQISAELPTDSFWATGLLTVWLFGMKPIMRVEPKYPVAAAQAKTEGYIVAEFDIQPDGTVRNVQIIKSVPAQVFDQVAVTALQQWAYSPSATGLKQAKVQLDFVMDPVSSDIERVEVSPTH